MPSVNCTQQSKAQPMHCSRRIDCLQPATTLIHFTASNTSHCLRFGVNRSSSQAYNHEIQASQNNRPCSAQNRSIEPHYKSPEAWSPQQNTHQLEHSITPTTWVVAITHNNKQTALQRHNSKRTHNHFSRLSTVHAVARIQSFPHKNGREWA
jgi:hypothetical protein